jgi:hypothetical protein
MLDLVLAAEIAYGVTIGGSREPTLSSSDASMPKRQQAFDG